VEDQNLALLETVLESQYLPHLPPLLDTRKSAADQRTKNLSRAFSAFALRGLCDITAQKAAQAVVDDYDDKGLDVVYYHGATETLYLVQGKFKKSETFGQDEALAFSQGVRKIIKEDFDGFNQNVLSRRVEIEDAVADCSEIKLVIAHIGSGVSQHAKDVMAELLADEADEERLCNPWIDFDTARVMAAIHASQAAKKIDGDLGLLKCQKVETPRLTYFGLIEIGSLVALHESHGAVLYERNIRSFLGKRTPVNAAIRDTLATSPESFVYLNNGVTMLADTIEPKNKKGERRRVSSVDATSNRLTVERKDGSEQTYNPRRQQGVSVYREEERSFSIGDRVQLTAPERDLGVANRELGTIVSIGDEKRIGLKMEDGRQIQMDVNQHPHLDHGYAVTSHSSQGQTAERVLVHVDTELGAKDLLNNRMAYVAISRGAHDAQLFTNDREKLPLALGHDVSHQSAHAPEIAKSVQQQEITPKQEHSYGHGISL
jgi:hypothetical protein